MSGLVIGALVGAVLLVGSVLDRPGAALPSATPVATAIPTTRDVAGLTWASGPTMSIGRAFHVAARLKDGSVLVASGGVPSHLFKSAEVFDPASGTFRTAAPLTQELLAPSATVLSDGRVMVAGGSGATAEVYDPQSNSWSLTGSMRQARLGTRAVLLLDGRVLVAGGAVGNAATATAEIYDPATNGWTTTGAMLTRRTDHSLTLLADGRVLVAGGALTPNGVSATEKAEIFDPATGVFSATSPLNHARARHAATLLADGRVLLVSGVDDADVLTSAEVFDPAAGTWTDVAEALEGREAFTATLLPDGRVLVVGGYSQNTASADVFDPILGTWQRTGDTASIRGYHTATLLLDGRVLVTGGVDESQTMLPSTELWPAGP